MSSESLYQKFWRMMDDITRVRPTSPGGKVRSDPVQGRRRWEKMKREIDVVNGFLSEAKDLVQELERRGVDVSRAKGMLQRLMRPIAILNAVNEATTEAVEAAEAVSLELATWYREAEAGCRDQAGGDSGQEGVCMAQVSRVWQHRNVKAVLGGQADSFTSRLWPKWRQRLLLLVF